MSLSSNFPTIKPSLNLDFANVGALDPRITFTRATTATYYDGVTTALAEQNLFTYSQDFDNAAWTGNGIGTKPSVTANSSVAPDGTTTADTLNFTTQYQAIGQGTWVSGVTYTFSVWMKVASGPRDINFTNASGTILATFTVTSTWTRFIYTGTSGNNVLVALQDRNASGFVSVDIWGAQLEQRSVVTAYTATTTQAITNYIPVLLTAAAGVARFDHTPTTGAALGLLIEEARTNLVTYSAQFDNAYWTKSNVTLSADNSVAPDGTVTADLVKPTSTGLDRRFEKTAITITNATSYTQTVYAKASGINFIYFADINNVYNNVWFDLSAGTASAPIVGSATITPVGNGWYRCSQTTTSSSTSGTFFVGLADSSGSRTSTASGNNGVLLWGAQLEAGSFATSYIPTVASTVTRNADVASVNTLSPWFNATEGTFFTDVDTANVSSGNSTVFFVYADSSNYILQKVHTDQNLRVGVAGVTVANLACGSPVNNTPVKFAVAYKANDFAGSMNGGAVATDSSGALPTGLTTFDLGRTTTYLNGHIRRLAYYPARLTNAQLQALTS